MHGFKWTYLQGWFIIDFVSVVPVHYIAYLPGVGDTDRWLTNRAHKCVFAMGIEATRFVDVFPELIGHFQPCMTDIYLHI